MIGGVPGRSGHSNRSDCSDPLRRPIGCNLELVLIGTGFCATGISSLQSDLLSDLFFISIAGYLSSLKMQSHGTLMMTDFHSGSRDTL